ncbi:uncharacterized protein [Paramisgurnus dabryanus]|uniref:uncharacterized protein n=1 Tax=Paramisgurnus dabryanus TaxID=90735 RepID=UPI0031F3C7D8
MKAFLSLSVLLALIRENIGKPTVFILQRYPLVYVGDDITFKCKGTSKPITWKINDVEQSNKNSLMVLMMVTPKNNGNYTCEKNGEKSEAFILTVLVLEPHAQLSLPIGGAVITKGEARILTLQVDEDLDKWKCSAFRNNVGYKLEVTKNKTMNMGTVYADLQDTQRATFWCMKSQTKHRSNALTLKMTERLVMLEPPVAPVFKDETITLRCAVWGGAEVTHADFYKDNKIVNSKEIVKSEEYKITNATESNNGEYKCIATYKYSHISSAAATHKHESDPQELKVIGGPPVAVLVIDDQGSLQCSCEQCESVCETYEWYYTDNSGTRTKLQKETEQDIDPTDRGSYICRVACQDGFSRFSTPHVFPGPLDGVGGRMVAVVLAAILIILVLVIIILVVLKCRRIRGMHSLRQGKETKKDKSEDKGVYHTLKAGEGSGEGSSQDQDQGGNEALQNVKAQVYQTLSSDGSGKPKEEAEGGYEQLPQKI